MLSIHNIFLVCFTSSALGTWDLFGSDQVEGRNPLTTAIAGGIIPMDDGGHQIPFNYQSNEGYGNHHRYPYNTHNRFNGMNYDQLQGHRNSYEQYPQEEYPMDLSRALQGIWQWLYERLPFGGNNEDSYYDHENFPYHYRYYQRRSQSEKLRNRKSHTA